MEESKYYVLFLVLMAITVAIGMTWLAVFMVDAFILVWFIICVSAVVWASN